MSDVESQFIEDHRALVASIAKKLTAQLDLSCDPDDLVAYGFHGLLEAKRRFDATRGVQFNTFAYYRIRGAMIDGIRKMAYLPRRAHAKLRAAEASDAIADDVATQRAAQPDARRDVDRTLDVADEALSRITAAFVLASVGQDEDSAPATPEERALGAETEHRLRRAVDSLPERERALVQGFYFEGRRFDEVADELGISKSWASRLHTKALDLLRESLETA